MRDTLPVFIRLLYGRISYVALLSLPYVAFGSVVSVWVMEQANVDPLVMHRIPYVFLSLIIVNFTLLVLLSISFWRTVFLREAPRLLGLRAAPRVFLTVLWRTSVAAVIAILFLDVTHRVSYGIIEFVPQSMRGRVPYLLFYSSISFVSYSIVTYLLSRLCLGVVSRSIGQRKLSVLKSWNATRPLRRQILIASVQLGAVVSLLYIGVEVFKMRLMLLAADYMTVYGGVLAQSILSMLVVLFVVWCLLALMAVMYSRAEGLPIDLNGNRELAAE